MTEKHKVHHWTSLGSAPRQLAILSLFFLSCEVVFAGLESTYAQRTGLPVSENCMLAWAKMGVAKSSEFDLQEDIGEVLLQENLGHIADAELLSLDESMVERILLDEIKDVRDFKKYLSKWRKKKENAQSRFVTFGPAKPKDRHFSTIVAALSSRLVKLENAKIKLGNLEDASNGESITAHDIREAIRIGVVVARIEMAALSYAIRNLATEELVKTLRNPAEKSLRPQVLLSQTIFQGLQAFQKLDSQERLKRTRLTASQLENIFQATVGYRLQNFTSQNTPESIKRSYLPSNKNFSRFDFEQEGFELFNSFANFLTKVAFLQHRLSFGMSAELLSRWHLPLMNEMHAMASSLEQVQLTERNLTYSRSGQLVDNWINLVQQFSVFIESVSEFPEKYYEADLDADARNYRFVLILETAERGAFFFKRMFRHFENNRNPTFVESQRVKHALIAIEQLASVWLHSSQSLAPIEVYRKNQTRSLALDVKFSGLLSMISSAPTVRQR